jgi:hypothetical protein
MTHVNLDAQDEAVRQFVLRLTGEEGVSVLELNGRPVACIVPPPKLTSGTEELKWTDSKNARRIDLIKKKHAEGLSSPEHVELGGLQEEMIRFRQKLAPLPLEDARRLHQGLLAQISADSPK